MKVILTYGTFDLLHVGHINMLERLRNMGDRLIVGVSTDEFNLSKGKQSVFGYDERARIVSALRFVDKVIPESCWDQKELDIQANDVSIFGIGEDWEGKFDHLQAYCTVCYLPRTPFVSSTSLKASLSSLDKATIDKIKGGLDDVLQIVKALN